VSEMMSQRITIDPITRIEGHAKITVQLNEAGKVEDAHFHVTQVRGFEKFCEGRPFTEMPSLMARICGICPVSHLIASSKACDALLAVQIPSTAVKLRRIMNLAQIMQSHALSFFYLSAPDLLLGMDAEPARRNLFGVLAQHPEMARDGIRLRSIGQQIIELLGGKRIHPAWVVPGGVSEPLSAEKREQMLVMLPEAREITLRALAWFKGALSQYREEITSFANFPSLFLALVNGSNELEHYDGVFRLVSSDGRYVADHLDPCQYQTYIEEKTENWTRVSLQRQYNASRHRPHIMVEYESSERTVRADIPRQKSTSLQKAEHLWTQQQFSRFSKSPRGIEGHSSIRFEMKPPLRTSWRRCAPVLTLIHVLCSVASSTCGREPNFLRDDLSKRGRQFQHSLNCSSTLIQMCSTQLATPLGTSAIPRLDLHFWKCISKNATTLVCVSRSPMRWDCANMLRQFPR